MNILSVGLPFFCAYDTLKAYRGAHVVRSLSAQPLGDFRFRPEVDSFADVLARITPEFVPDLVLVWTPENDPPPLGIEMSPVPTVCLAGDWNIFSHAQEVNFGRYDVVLSDRPGTRLLRNSFCAPSYWGPLYAHDPALHRPMGVGKDIDVLYLGSLNLTHRGPRQRWLQRVANLPDDLEVLLTTNAWGDDYAGALSRSRIVFNHSVRGELNLRVFETLACGSLPFFERYNEEVGDFFEDGVDIVLFDEGDFEEKVRYYLSHWGEAEAIIARGQEKVRQFAGVARLDDLVAYALAQPRSGRPFLQLDAMERALQDHLMVTVSQRHEYGPLEQRLGAALGAAYPEEPRALSAHARSALFFRTIAPGIEAGRLCIDLHRRAAMLDEASVIHAMNGANAARAVGNSKGESLFLQVTLRGKSLSPSGYLWGGWNDNFWMKWLRCRAEGTATVAMVHAEAHARLSRIAREAGNFGEALVHAQQAAALAPADEDYAFVLSELLWLDGRRAEALGMMVGLAPGLPLDAGFRVSLAEKCIQMGFGNEAAALLDEVERIGRRYRVPYASERGPVSHAVSREVGAVSPVVWQEARLRERAVATGDFAGLLWFLATLGRLEEVGALVGGLGTEAVAAEARALGVLLLEEGLSAARGLEVIGALREPGLFHGLVKRCLAVDDREGAWAVVEAGLAAVPGDVSSLNLLVRYLSQVGDARLEEAVARSLGLAPQQQDIADLRGAAFVGEVYLGVAPKLVPITFYLPAYNVERYIRDTIEHVFLQDYPLGEFLVVDDGGSDGSVAIAREYPVTIVRHGRNEGLAAARNTALVEGMGAWLLTVDTDARPERAFSRRVLMEVETRDAAVAAVGGVLVEDFQETAADRWRASVMAQEHGGARQCPPWFLYGSTMCVERAVAIGVGGYDVRHRTNGEDTELGKALAGAGRRLCYSPLVRAHHRRQDSVESALRTWWNWHFWVKEEAQAWNVVGQLVHGMLHNLSGATAALQGFLDGGDAALCRMGFLLVVHDPLCDLAQAVRVRLLYPGEARTLAEAVLARVAGLDARFGGDLLSVVRRELGVVIGGLEGCGAETILPGLEQEMGRYFSGLDALLGSFSEELYRGILNAADAG